MHPFKGNQGNLRPDILFPETPTGEVPDFRICEINARFPISFLHFAATCYEALATSHTWNNGLKPAADYKTLFDSLFELFDPRYRVFFLRGRVDSIPEDSSLFGIIEERTGLRPRLISPDDLRLVPCRKSRTGFVLCCIANFSAPASAFVPSPSPSPNPLPRQNNTTEKEENLEQIHQTALQLIDYELFALPRDIQRHIILTSRNDPRSIFLAHDKRFLGIIRQELPALVHKHRVLNAEQAYFLERRVIPTILPGERQMRELLELTRRQNQGLSNGNGNGNAHERDHVKNTYILKPARQARGAGILLGKHLSHTQWESILTGLLITTSPNSTPAAAAAAQYTLQTFLHPLRTLPWFWDEERKTRATRTVGTYFSVNGRFVGFGMLRSAISGTGDADEEEQGEVISASSGGTMGVFAVVHS